jgi:hypothetical protein
MRINFRGSWFTVIIFFLIIGCTTEPETRPSLPLVITETNIPEPTLTPFIPLGTDTPTPDSSAITPQPTPPPPTPFPTPSIANIVAGLEGLPIDEFLDEAYRQLQLRDPDNLIFNGFAEVYGVVENNQFTNLSESYIRETQQMESEILDLLQAYDRDTLTPGATADGCGADER